MLEKIKDLSIIISCISGIIGIYVIGHNIHQSYKQSRYSCIDHAVTLIHEEDRVQDSVARFLLNFKDTFDCTRKIEEHRSGFQYYHSDEMLPYLYISHHYETAGTLISEGYIDFELYFQVVAFPDEFYETTKPVKKCICDNWYGKEKPLRDFLINFEALRDKYIIRRKQI